MANYGAFLVGKIYYEDFFSTAGTEQTRRKAKIMWMDKLTLEVNNYYSEFSLFGFSFPAVLGM